MRQALPSDGCRCAERASHRHSQCAVSMSVSPKWPPLKSGSGAFFRPAGGQGSRDDGASVRNGRRREFARFEAFRDPAARARIPDPTADGTFRRSVLDWTEIEHPVNRAWCEFCRRLLAVRRTDIVPRLRGMKGHSGFFERLGDRGLSCRWILGDGSELSLLANLGAMPCSIPPEAGRGRPLYDLPEGAASSGALPGWSVRWHLAAPDGGGTHQASRSAP